MKRTYPILYRSPRGSLVTHALQINLLKKIYTSNVLLTLLHNLFVHIKDIGVIFTKKEERITQNPIDARTVTELS